MSLVRLGFIAEDPTTNLGATPMALETSSGDQGRKRRSPLGEQNDPPDDRAGPLAARRIERTVNDNSRDIEDCERKASFVTYPAALLNTRSHLKDHRRRSSFERILISARLPHEKASSTRHPRTSRPPAPRPRIRRGSNRDSSDPHR